MESHRQGVNRMVEMVWPGKKASIAQARKRTKCKLAPCPEESRDWDKTGNLYIEGDNLDALKLLKKTSAGEVGVIFIDPPYNTGSGSFVYDDSCDPRFHARWCSMMYPRLMLARELLSPEGVIFISLDDGENAHTRMMMDEIFGEKNFVAEFIWEKKKKPSFLHRNVGKLFDYILCYAKELPKTGVFSVEKTTAGKKYPLNNARNAKKTLVFPAGSVTFGFREAVIEPQDMSEGNIYTGLLKQVIVKDFTNVTDIVLDGEWRYSQEKLDQVLADGGKISIHKVPFRPNHVRVGGEPKAMKNILSQTHYACETNEDASAQIMEIFGRNIFETPKPVGLMKLLIRAVTYDHRDAVILDFFSGSASTAHAVMALNAEDGGNRRFIMVQTPEACKPKSEAYKAGYETISQIGKERIRRAQEVLRAQYGAAVHSVDTGFQVWKVKA